MIKYILTFIACLSIFIFGQDEGNKQNEPDVELPKFVIYGTQKMNIGNVEKLEAEDVSNLSENIIKPFVLLDESKMSGLSGSENLPVRVHDSVKIIKNNLDLQAGFYTIPFANYNLQIPFKSGFFQGNFFGKNTRPFVDYSDNYKVGGELKFSLFSDDVSSFLPSTNYNFIAGFQSDDYKFYGGSEPALKRSLNNVYTQIDIKNLSKQVFYFGVNAVDEINNIKTENYLDNLLQIKPFLRMQLTDFSLGINVDYKNQNITNNTVSKQNTQYLVLSPIATLSFFDNMKVNFGVNYSMNNYKNNFAIYSALALKVDKNLSLFADFNPNTEFITAGSLLKQNKYLNLSGFTNMVLKKSSSFSAIIKYEYENIFQASGGFRYTAFDNLPYYKIDSTGSNFNIRVANAKQAQFELNGILYPGAYGSLYASLIFSDTHNDVNLKVPYFEKLSVKAGYEYSFGKYTFGGELNIKNSIYTDSLNLNMLNSFYKVDVYTKYHFSNNINLVVRVDNLFDSKNYLWQNYKALPLDLSAGISIRW